MHALFVHCIGLYFSFIYSFRKELFDSFHSELTFIVILMNVLNHQCTNPVRCLNSFQNVRGWIDLQKKFKKT